MGNSLGCGGEGSMSLGVPGAGLAPRIKTYSPGAALRLERVCTLWPTNGCVRLVTAAWVLAAPLHVCRYKALADRPEGTT